MATLIALLLSLFLLASVGAGLVWALTAVFRFLSAFAPDSTEQHLP